MLFSLSCTWSLVLAMVLAAVALLLLIRSSLLIVSLGLEDNIMVVPDYMAFTVWIRESRDVADPFKIIFFFDLCGWWPSSSLLTEFYLLEEFWAVFNFFLPSHYNSSNTYEFKRHQSSKMLPKISWLNASFQLARRPDLQIPRLKMPKGVWLNETLIPKLTAHLAWMHVTLLINSACLTN